MKIQFSSVLTGLFCYLLLVPSAEAHSFSTETTGLIQGLIHPFLGLDHLLAMIAVGIWAGQLGGKSVWLLPLSFLSAMVIGSGLGYLGLALPVVEPMIASSVLALGLMIVSAVRLSMLTAMLLIAWFALFHGAAHGLELPGNASPMLYGLGFVVATGLLHYLGVGLGQSSRHYQSIQRLLGFGLIAASTLLLTP